MLLVRGGGSDYFLGVLVGAGVGVHFDGWFLEGTQPGCGVLVTVGVGVTVGV